MRSLLGAVLRICRVEGGEFRVWEKEKNKVHVADYKNCALRISDVSTRGAGALGRMIRSGLRVSRPLWWCLEMGSQGTFRRQG